MPPQQSQCCLLLCAVLVLIVISNKESISASAKDLLSVAINSNSSVSEELPIYDKYCKDGNVKPSKWNLHGVPGDGYYLVALIGSPPQSVNLLVDTGSSNLAVAAAASSQLDEQFFRANDSSSYEGFSHSQFRVSYTQGWWEGELGRDIVLLPHVSCQLATRAYVALITRSHGFYVRGSHWQGILGLGFPELSQPNKSVQPWFDSLVSQHSAKLPEQDATGLHLDDPRARSIYVNNNEPDSSANDNYNDTVNSSSEVLKHSLTDKIRKQNPLVKSSNKDSIGNLLETKTAGYPDRENVADKGLSSQNDLGAYDNGRSENNDRDKAYANLDELSTNIISVVNDEDFISVTTIAVDVNENYSNNDSIGNSVYSTSPSFEKSIADFLGNTKNVSNIVPAPTWPLNYSAVNLHKDVRNSFASDYETATESGNTVIRHSQTTVIDNHTSFRNKQRSVGAKQTAAAEAQTQRPPSVGVTDVFGLELCGHWSAPRHDSHVGRILLGDDVESCGSGEWVDCPIIAPWFYEVAVVDMAVGGRSLGLPCGTYNARSSIVDSGTTKLKLPHQVLNGVVSALEAASEGLSLPQDFWRGEGRVCWTAAHMGWAALPQLTIQLAVSNSSALTLGLGPRSYLRPLIPNDTQSDASDADGVPCWTAGIEPSNLGTVLGVAVLEGLCTRFDRSRGVVGFRAADCGPRVMLTGPSPHTGAGSCTPRDKETGVTVTLGVLLAVICSPIIVLAMRWLWLNVITKRRQNSSSVTGQYHHCDEVINENVPENSVATVQNIIVESSQLTSRSPFPNKRHLHLSSNQYHHCEEILNPSSLEESSPAAFDNALAATSVSDHSIVAGAPDSATASRSKVVSESPKVLPQCTLPTVRRDRENSNTRLLQPTDDGDEWLSM